MVNGFKVNLSDVAGVDFASVYDMITQMRITNFADLMACIVEHYPSFLQYVSSHSTLVRNFVNDYAKAIL